MENFNYMENIEPLLDILIVGFTLSCLLVYVVKKKLNTRSKLNRGIICVGVLAICALFMSATGYFYFNNKVVIANQNKMPEPYEEVFKITQDRMKINKLNNYGHRVMLKSTIKEYQLCDRFYIKRILLAHDIFYSVGDVMIFSGGILMVLSFFTATYCVKKVLRI